MNLFDMARRKDDNLILSGDISMAKSSQHGATWRGLQLSAGSSFRIPDLRRFVSFRAYPATCGWMVETPAELYIRVSMVRHETDDVLAYRDYSGAFQPLFLPWPQAIGGKVDLVVEAAGSSRHRAFIANHRALSRQWLIDAAVGNGVEIGPGAQPQILPREGVNVSYLEQMPPEEWNRLYNGGGKYVVRPELWDNYIVGDASDLPVADRSLDFLFGSHVFEHLANPIGHLRRWRDKMAPGGKILCVVPDLAGTKDAIQQRSTLAEWMDEYAHGTWNPTEAHYVRHLRRPAGEKQTLAAMERNESIHVHYYDNINCQILLEYAVSELGYSDYIIEHTPNHKDFHFMLVNG
jgi:predicted SAM-dependent methyltransferase